MVMYSIKPHPKREVINSILAVLPALTVYFVFSCYPLFLSLIYSFTDWDGISKSYNFVGLRNFIALFKDDMVFLSFKNTIHFAVIAAIVGTILQMIIAIILHGKFTGRNVFRAIFYIPAVISTVVMALSWRNILQYVGFVNTFLKNIGLEHLSKDWLGSTGTAMNSLILINTLQYLGIGMIIFLAGLNSIPHDVYEASELDGAVGFKNFLYITLPLIMPSVTIVSFTAITGALKFFDLPYLMTNGGPANATISLSMEVYNLLFSNNTFGLGSAVGFVFSIFIAAVSLLQLRVTRSREVEY